jgi:hypothetical protein
VMRRNCVSTLSSPGSHQTRRAIRLLRCAAAGGCGCSRPGQAAMRLPARCVHRALRPKISAPALEEPDTKPGHRLLLLLVQLYSACHRRSPACSGCHHRQNSPASRRAACSQSACAFRRSDLMPFAPPSKDTSPA